MHINEKMRKGYDKYVEKDYLGNQEMEITK